MVAKTWQDTSKEKRNIKSNVVLFITQQNWLSQHRRRTCNNLKSFIHVGSLYRFAVCNVESWKRISANVLEVLDAFSKKFFSNTNSVITKIQKKKFLAPSWLRISCLFKMLVVLKIKWLGFSKGCKMLTKQNLWTNLLSSCFLS